jgi:hypothetical protein
MIVAVKREKKTVRLMSPIEYSRARSRLGLQHPLQTASLLGQSLRTAQRQASGESKIDGSTTALMRLAAEGVITLSDIRRVLT